MSKTSKRRPTQVDKEIESRRWCRTFGHWWKKHSDHCVRCGVSKKEKMENEQRES